MFSERVLKNLARSRRNAFLLRSMCISRVLLLPRLDLLVFNSVLGGRAYLLIFWRFDKTRMFRLLPVHVRIFNVFACRFYSCFIVFCMTNHDVSIKFKMFVHILRIRDAFGAKCVKRTTIIEQNKLSWRYKALICIRFLFKHIFFLKSGGEWAKHRERTLRFRKSSKYVDTYALFGYGS